MLLTCEELRTRNYVSYEDLHDSKSSIDMLDPKKDPIVLVYLGVCYETGIHFEKCKMTAVDLYKEASRRKVPLGHVYLGMCYEYGYGVEKDYFLAFKLYKKSNHPQGKVMMGKCYENSKGVEYNSFNQRVRCLALYQEAIKENHPSGMLATANHMLKNNANAQTWFISMEYLRRAVDMGHSDSQRILASELLKANMVLNGGVSSTRIAIDLYIKSTKYVKSTASINALESLTREMTPRQMEEYVSIVEKYIPVNEEYNTLVSSFIKDGDECPICMELLCAPFDIFVSKCLHCFHDSCMRGVKRCPLCRVEPVEKL